MEQVCPKLLANVLHDHALLASSLQPSAPSPVWERNTKASWHLGRINKQELECFKPLFSWLVGDMEASAHGGTFVGPGTLVIGKRDPARRVMSLDAVQLAGCKEPTATLQYTQIMP